MTKEEAINFLIKDGVDTNLISDGFHTFGELYDFRAILTAHLFNHYRDLDFIGGDHKVHKSWKHNDGEWCFGKEREWFIVCKQVRNGKHISFHYPAKYWHLFKIPEKETSMFLYDGHTSEDVLNYLIAEIC